MYVEFVVRLFEGRSPGIVYQFLPAYSLTMIGKESGEEFVFFGCKGNYFSIPRYFMLLFIHSQICDLQYLRVGCFASAQDRTDAGKQFVHVEGLDRKSTRLNSSHMSI